jgi:hypothetical protein
MIKIAGVRQKIKVFENDKNVNLINPVGIRKALQSFTNRPLGSQAF